MHDLTHCVLTSADVRCWHSIVNVSEFRALCQKVILHSRGGDKDKIFHVSPMKSYRSDATAPLIFKLGAR